MYLYELAIELDKRSADLAEKAEALGIGPIIAASELSADQVQALRAAFPRAGVAAEPAAVAGPSTWGAPPGATAPAPAGPSKTSRAGSLLAVGTVLAAVIGMFAFIMVKSGPDDERRKQISADLKAWDEAPAVTVDPAVADAAAKAVPPDQPIDQAKMCAAQDVMYDAEIRINRGEGSRDADLVTWRKAVDDMAAWGPADLRDEINAYRDAVAAMYDVEGREGRGNARPQFDKVKEVEDPMYSQIIPFCGYPGD